jgi:pilus assembly protein TadC
LTPLLIVTAVLGIAWTLFRAWRIHELGLARLAHSETSRLAPVSEKERGGRPGPVRRWLLVAGYTRANAPELFIGATFAAMGIGAIAAWLADPLVADMAGSLLEIPGGIGGALAAVVGVIPYAIVVISALTPTLVVRAARRRRVSAIDRDLPLVLELLATMAQAGLGLDAAIARVVEVQPPERPLTKELRAFQHDLLAGVPRSQALRHLAGRIDVTSLTVFVAAVVQAEQVGASIAETLRLQADDLRGRRREQALLVSQALPVKLVLPLVTCFLPGIFLSTLGPVLYQMVQVANTILRPVGR